MAATWPEKNNCASARHAADRDLHAAEPDLHRLTRRPGGGSMPFIHVDLEAGLTEEQKIELTRRIVEVTHDAIGSAPGHINVVIRDWPAANIVEAGRSLAGHRVT
jgi:phenylpyruvate tautomerase PptA (4-oxalocrotonate tautomerase family)